ncbi:phosphoserine phosphatase SerB [Altererythrobacter sp. H2]|uniref:phosphoserine phosphatase SerB n=1 Tax=Altererythrobacter sp. H2 TaxID=3108391 RepID=UPI002B4BC7CF|nr:phosphoserine phosphatase SerB [Altererythrobacter sp. H2]WRK94835.1 phosphoserine phosphatase SerB [Altererythrobacter sp. H2]
MLIARLIADPATLETRLDAAIAALEENSLRVASAALLERVEGVVELTLPEGDPAALLAVLDSHFDSADMLAAQDLITLPRLFVSDMDSTMIGQECIDELADYAGLKDQIAGITERAMQGELDFESALRERVGLLAGLGEEAIDQCLTDRIRPMEGARTLVATLRAHGVRTVLVTGGFHHFADPVAELLGFERVVGNRLEVGAGQLTGGLLGDVADSGTKLRVLQDEAAQLGENVVTLATGDGANDIPMIEAATYGVAYRAKPKARLAANGRIDRGDLTSVLKLLGIPRSDWTAA